jgi:hypothetical protein
VSTRKKSLIVRGIVLLAFAAFVLQPMGEVSAQGGQATPLRQSDLTRSSAVVRPLTLREASHNDRRLGLGVRDVRWAPDGSGVYFRWSIDPSADDVQEEDPWFRTTPSGARAWQIPMDEAAQIPSAAMRWSATGHRAIWVRDGTLHLFDGDKSAAVVTLDRAIREPRFTQDGNAVDFQVDGSLYRYHAADGTLAVLAQRVVQITSCHRPMQPIGWLSNKKNCSITCETNKGHAVAWQQPPVQPACVCRKAFPYQMGSRSIRSSYPPTETG